MYMLVRPNPIAVIHIMVLLKKEMICGRSNKHFSVLMCGLRPMVVLWALLTSQTDMAIILYMNCLMYLVIVNMHKDFCFKFHNMSRTPPPLPSRPPKKILK